MIKRFAIAMALVGLFAGTAAAQVAVGTRDAAGNVLLTDEHIDPVSRILTNGTWYLNSAVTSSQLVTKAYVDAAVGGAGDNLGNHTGTQDLDMGNFTVFAGAISNSTELLLGSETSPSENSGIRMEPNVGVLVHDGAAVLNWHTRVLSGGLWYRDSVTADNALLTTNEMTTYIANIRGAADGIAPLDSGQKIPSQYIPAIAITDVYTPATMTAMTNLLVTEGGTADVGDVAIVQDDGNGYLDSFIVYTNDPGGILEWKKIEKPADYVSKLDFGADGDFLVGTGAGSYTTESGSTARDSLGLGASDVVTHAALFANSLTNASGSELVMGVANSPSENTGIRMEANVGALMLDGAQALNWHNKVLSGKWYLDSVSDPANLLLSSNQIASVIAAYGYVPDSSFTADGDILVGTGSGTYTAESGDTARTSLGLGTGDSPTFTALTLSAGPFDAGGGYVTNLSTLYGVDGAAITLLDDLDGLVAVSLGGGTDGGDDITFSGGGTAANLGGLDIFGSDANGTVAVTLGHAAGEFRLGTQLGSEFLTVYAGSSNFNFHGNTLTNFATHVVEITDDLTLVASDMGGTIIASNQAQEIVVTLPDGTDALVGTEFTFANLSTNILTIDAGASDVIDDSGVGSQIYSGYNDVNAWPYSSIKLKLIDANQWHVLHARGTWTTTGTGGFTIPWTKALGGTTTNGAYGVTNHVASFGVTFDSPPAVTLTLGTNLAFQATVRRAETTTSNVTYQIQSGAGFVTNFHEIMWTANPTL